MAGYNDYNPAIFKHALTVYDTMRAGAVEDGQGAIVFLGSGTKIISDLKLSESYYSKIFKVLKDLGAVTQLKRGGGTAPSVWRLDGRPTDEQFSTARNEGKFDILPERQYMGENLEDIKKRVLALEEGLARITQAFIAMAPRLSEVANDGG